MGYSFACQARRLAAQLFKKPTMPGGLHSNTPINDKVITQIRIGVASRAASLRSSRPTDCANIPRLNVL